MLSIRSRSLLLLFHFFEGGIGTGADSRFFDPFGAHTATALAAASASGQCPFVVGVHARAWGGELERNGNMYQRFTYTFSLDPMTVSGSTPCFSKQPTSTEANLRDEIS